MGTFTFNYGSSGSFKSGVLAGFYISPGAPASDTSLFEIYSPATGTLQLIHKASNNALYAAATINSWSGYLTDNSSTPIAVPTNEWVWLSLLPCSGSDNGFQLNVAMLNNLGTQIAGIYFAQSGLLTGTWYSCVLGVGMSPSGTGGAAIPTGANRGFSKIYLNGASMTNGNYKGSAPLNCLYMLAPTSDWTTGSTPSFTGSITGTQPGAGATIPAGYGGFWNFQESLGTDGVIHDGSGNSLDISGSFLVLANGPFA